MLTIKDGIDPYIDGEDMVADINGAWIDCSHIKYLSFDITYAVADTPAGAFKVMVSNDYAKPAATGGRDLGVTGHTDPDGAGSDTSTTISLAEVPFKWVRLFYDRTANGDGDLLTVRVNGKE